MINGSISTVACMPHIHSPIQWLFQRNQCKMHSQPSIDKCVRLWLYVDFWFNGEKKLHKRIHKQAHTYIYKFHICAQYSKINGQENGKRNGKEDKTFMFLFFFLVLLFRIVCCCFAFFCPFFASILLFIAMELRERDTTAHVKNNLWQLSVYCLFFGIIFRWPFGFVMHMLLQTDFSNCACFENRICHRINISELPKKKKQKRFYPHSISKNVVIYASLKKPYDVLKTETNLNINPFDGAR